MRYKNIAIGLTALSVGLFGVIGFQNRKKLGDWFTFGGKVDRMREAGKAGWNNTRDFFTRSKKAASDAYVHTEKPTAEQPA